MAVLSPRYTRQLHIICLLKGTTGHPFSSRDTDSIMSVKKLFAVDICAREPFIWECWLVGVVVNRREALQ